MAMTGQKKGANMDAKQRIELDKLNCVIQDLQRQLTVTRLAVESIAAKTVTPSDPLKIIHRIQRILRGSTGNATETQLLRADLAMLVTAIEEGDFNTEEAQSGASLDPDKVVNHIEHLMIKGSFCEGVTFRWVRDDLQRFIVSIRRGDFGDKKGGE
jgi:hypothetical protein